ncbi:MAG: hypothetical protein WCX46_03220 [Candidatus Paceibacterota bacterium]
MINKHFFKTLLVFIIMIALGILGASLVGIGGKGDPASITGGVQVAK